MLISRNRIIDLSFAVSPILFWWLTLFPAVLTGDSVYLLEQIKAQNSDPLHTLAYYYFVKFLSLNGSHVEIVSLIQLILNFYVLRKVIQFLIPAYPRNLNSLRLTGLVFLTPFFGPISATIWKDNPYTALVILGLLQLLSQSSIAQPSFKLFKSRNKTFFGLILIGFGSLFRSEGPFVLAACAFALTLSVFLTRFFAKPPSKHIIYKLASIFLLASIISFAIQHSVNKLPGVVQNDRYLLTLSFLLDLQRVNSSYPDLLSGSTKSKLDLISTGPSLRAAQSCHSNFDFFGPGLNREQANKYTFDIVTMWIETLNSNARNFLLETRVCRSSSVNLPFFAKIPEAGFWPTTGISPNENLVERPNWAKFIYPIGFAWSYLWGINGNLVAWPGLHLMLLTWLFYWRKSRRLLLADSKTILLVLSFLYCRSFIISISASSQEFRYLFAIYFFTIPIIFHSLMVAFTRNKLLNTRPT